MLTKNPSKQADILAQYDKLYAAKAKSLKDPDEPKAPTEVSTRRKNLKAAKTPSLDKAEKPKKTRRRAS
jgi:hypothetical protein